jgi:SAM-dependent methyltransferase
LASFIGLVPETDLSDKDVLDFGCNQGGFLRLLHALRPFRHGVGVDIAQESVAAAQSLRGNLPIDYCVASDLQPWAGKIDIAFSYEAIYLLPDLADHATEVYRALRDGGVYYAATGCHTDSHLWPLWRSVIADTSNAPVQDYAPEDYRDAFAAQGFSVSVRKFGFDGFVPVAAGSPYYPKIVDALIYAADDRLLFRFVKPRK